MLNLNIERKGKSLQIELPLPIETLADELKSIGIYEPQTEISRDSFTLEPTNELGEHFMKMLSPDDSLHQIAIACREPSVLADEPRRKLEALILNDKFQDLDHMMDYLRYGAAALDHVIRLPKDLLQAYASLTSVV